MPDMIFVVKRDGMVLRVSHPDYGTPGGGEVGRSFLGFFAHEHSADITRSFEKVFALGEPQSFVCRGNPPLAVGAWYHCRVSPNHGESGVEAATVFARDITEWKHNEDESRAEIDALVSLIAGLSSEDDELPDLLAGLEQREEELSRFRAIMNHAGEAIFITEARTGRFVDVNETACRWLGDSRERLLQMCVGDLDLEFPLESSDGDIDHVADTRDANRPKAFVRGSHRRRNGTSFPVEVALSRRRFGDRDFLLVVARDIKQRRRAEQTSLLGEHEHRGLFAVSRDAVYCSARDGTVSEVNDSAIDLFGYSRGEFLGLEARRLYRNPQHIRAFQRAVEEDGSVKNVRAEFQTKTGQSFQGSLGATLNHDADGNLQGYQCIISPVGETASPDSRDAEADAPPKTPDTDTAQDEPANNVWLWVPGALEREAEQAKREIEDARSETATARADAEQAMSQAAKAKSDAEEATRRAETLEREAEQAKREIEDARSEAATARADAEVRRTGRGTRVHVKRLLTVRAASLATKAKLDAEEAKERPDAQKEEVAQARSEIEDARSDTTEMKLRVEEATKQAVRAWAEAEAAQSGIRTVKLGALLANLDAEQARSETAKAKLDTDEAKA